MDNRECMVSIWCTCYNHAQYVAQALDSFLMQETDFPYEIIISDDASPDGSADIIRSYAEKYPDIIRPILLEENLFSTGANMFQALFFERSRGKYVALCEGDDYWTDPKKLQLQVDFMERHPEYSACVHNTMLLYCGTDQESRLLLKNDSDIDIPLKTMLSGNSRSYHTSSLLCRAELICSPPDFYFVANDYGFDDHAIALWMYLNGKVRYLDRCMSVYRINSTASAWSSEVDWQYDKLCRFISGEIAMLKVFAGHVEGPEKSLAEQEILEREFELMYIQGRDREQRKAPYRELLNKKPFKYRVFNFLKSYVPGLSKAYRRVKGYTD